MEEEVYVYRGYDIYTYFISNVDTYLGRAIVGKIRGGHVELDVGHTLIAFSKGGPVNRLAQELLVGDKIEWFGICDLNTTTA